MTRHERRRRLKELRKVMKSVERRGMKHRPTLVEIAALVALVEEKMDSTPIPGRSSKIVTMLSGLQGKSIQNAPAAGDLACKQGCYFCCDLYVSGSAPQIFAIADWIRAGTPDVAAEISRLEEAGEKVRGKNPDDRSKDRALCLFLRDGLCGIYPVRPPACQAHCSLSLAACEAGFRGESEEIPIPEYTNVMRGGYEQALSAVLHQRGLSTSSYELAHAVLVALRDPGAEEKWYRGEDVFAGVAIDQADLSLDAETMKRELDFWVTLCDVAEGKALASGPLADGFPAWAV